MNDNTDAIDELVSRYLDAEVTDDEARARRIGSRTPGACRRNAIGNRGRRRPGRHSDDRSRPAAHHRTRRNLNVNRDHGSLGSPGPQDRATQPVCRGGGSRRAACRCVYGDPTRDLDDDDQDNVATESTENAGDSAAAADEALEMFADDRATEEAADMAESAAVETDDWAGADFGDDAAPEHSTSDAATMAGPSVDVLPDELAPVETVDDIVDVVDTAYADVIGIPHRSDPFDGICPEAIRLITEVQGDTTVSVEATMVEIGAERVTVLVALAAITGTETSGA